MGRDSVTFCKTVKPRPRCGEVTPPTEGLQERHLNCESNVTLGRPSVGRVGGVGDPRRAPRALAYSDNDCATSVR